MTCSRRCFLGIAAVAPLALSERLARGSRLLPGALRSAASPGAPGCGRPVLVDLAGDCALPESLSGFARGLAAAFMPFERVSANAIPAAGLVVVPGAVLNSSCLARALRALCDRGATVVYESGAAFACSEAFRRERDLLARYFGLRVQTPLELWPERVPSAVPYVRYEWPSKLMVRDFSRVIPVAGERSVVAWFGDLPVACRRSMGSGALVFLGSPLGPHLGCADPEAMLLLKALVTSELRA